MVRNTVYLKGLFLFAIVFALKVSAHEVNIKTHRVDLSTEYGVLLTEIHYDEKNIELALRVEEIVKNDLIKVVNYFQYVPESIVHININPYTLVSNGNAAVFPANIINLYQVPPSNASHIVGIEDWFRGLLFHEFIHITQLDQTRGIWKVGRNIFGSIAKIPNGVVPTWFTEGVAVWGESHLIEGGRLNYSNFNKEFSLLLKRADSCKEISCLDDPGSFPHRSLAYLAGAHFLEFIEDQRPNAIKCIIYENSKDFPFGLNGIFSKCTGKTATEQFSDFKNKFLLADKNEIKPANEMVISNTFGADYLEAGFSFDGTILLKVEGTRYEKALVSYDLEDNLPMRVAKFDAPIEDLSNFIENQNDPKQVLVSFSDDPNYRQHTKAWKILNAEALSIESDLNFKNNPQYALSLGNNKFLVASNSNLVWTLNEVEMDSEGNEISSKSVTSFNNNQSIKGILKIDQKIVVKIFEDSKNVLYLYENEKFQKIYETPSLLEILSSIKNALFVRENKEVKLLEFKDQKVTEYFVIKAPHEDFLMTSNAIVEMNDQIQISKINVSEYLSDLKKSGVLKAEHIFKSDSQVSPKVLASTSKTYNYPSMDHFLPHYWFLATGSGENVSSLGVRTELFDPMFYNHITTAVYIYPEESKVGGEFEFTHKFMKNDLLSTNLYLNREYFKSNFNNALNEDTEATLSLNYSFLNKKWTYIPGVFASYKESSDFVNTTSLNSFGGSFLVNYNALSFHEFFQSLRVYGEYSFQSPDKSDSFKKLRLKIENNNRLTDRLIFGLKSSYSKQFKDAFKGGVVFAGGVSDFTNQRFHEFYGIPYGDAFGNEIFNFRAHVDYNVWNAYKGYDLVPVYLKEVHLLLGMELLNAERIFVEEAGVLRNKTLYSVFFGPRLLTNIFYYVPVNIDVIFASLKASGMKNTNTVEVNLNMELF